MSHNIESGDSTVYYGDMPAAYTDAYEQPDMNIDDRDEPIGPEDWAAVESPIPAIGSHSDAMARTLRENVLTRHQQWYEAKNHPELASNVPPEALLGHPLVTGRVREFFARNWRVAPLYERYGADEPIEDDALANIASAAELFQSHTLGEPATRMDRHFQRVALGDEAPSGGLYSRLILASTTESQTAISSERIHTLLVAHMLHEDHDQALQSDLDQANPDLSSLLQILRDRPPHYMLLEAARYEPTETES